MWSFLHVHSEGLPGLVGQGLLDVKGVGIFHILLWMLLGK